MQDSSKIKTQRCFETLCDFRLSRLIAQDYFSNLHGTFAYSANPNQTLRLPVSGSDVGKNFAISAATNLTRLNFAKLMIFLKNGKRTPVPENPRLEKDKEEQIRRTLEQEWLAFKKMEIKLSGQDSETSVELSSAIMAELGIVLHCQSKKGEVSGFWDEENYTIITLLRKGLDRDNIFGFDWHWRAESSLHNRHSNCPFRGWPPELRAAHDDWSARVLEILPLPFLLAAGNVRATVIRRRLRTVSICIPKR